MQTRTDFKILVIDNGSTDKTDLVFANLQYDVLRDETGNLCHLFNIGWRMTSTEFVAYLNDDSEPSNEWFESAMRVLDDDKTVMAVGGPTLAMNAQEMYSLIGEAARSVLLWPMEKFYELYIAEGKVFEPGLIFRSGAISIGGSLLSSARLSTQRGVDCLSFTNIVIRRIVFDRLGPLDENLIWSQIDGDLFLRMTRAKMKLIFHPHVLVKHYVSPTGATRDPYSLAADFGYFASKHLLNRTCRDQPRVWAYILFYNLFWVYKALLGHNMGALAGVKGYYDGVKRFRAASSAIAF